MGREPPASGMKGKLRDNIDALTRRREEERARAPMRERIAGLITAFTGSMTFVVIHAIVFGAWIAVNLLNSRWAFDPSLVYLAMTASVEAIFLSTFVLISQNRMAAVADKRADLDLHINLLAEHELTRLAALIERVAERLDVGVADPDFAEITQDVEPQAVLDALDKEPPASGA